MKTTASLPESSDLVTRLVRSDLFERYREALLLTTGCALRMVRDEQHRRGTSPSYSFVTELCVPVTLNGRPFVHLCAEPVRINDGKAETFESAARQMLNDGCSATDLRAARRWFDKLPAMTSERARALETMLRLFAAQLGEYGERLFLQTADCEPESVRRARQHILSHLTEQLSLEDVARHAGVSPFHFCKIFKRATRLTFTEFVNRARVEQAKRLLLKPQRRITEVAYDVGFQSLSQFNRSFRRVTDESPTQYRAHLRNPALAAA
ncbi:MAG: helix-turn-helix domain-containing protein [Verrucomicrobiaceae bacterium]